MMEAATTASATAAVGVRAVRGKRRAPKLSPLQEEHLRSEVEPKLRPVVNPRVKAQG